MNTKFANCTFFSAIIFVVMYLFWYCYKPDIMYYQEISQMFLLTSDYFLELVRRPGGLSDYLSEFLVQFYYYPAIGGAIIALIFTGIFAAGYRLSIALGAPRRLVTFLHFVPVLLIWHTTSDIHVMHNLMLSVLLCQLTAWLCVYLLDRRSTVAMMGAAIIIGVAYFLFGPAVYVAAIAAVYHSIRGKKPIIYPVAILLCLALSMAVSIRLCMYPVPRFFYGIDYFRFHNFRPEILLSILASGLLPCVWLSEKWARKTVVVALGCAVAISCAGAIVLGSNSTMYRTVHYLKLAHQRKWTAIIKDAEQNRPTNSTTMVLVNMALAFDNKLADSMFRFPQQDSRCLVPELSNDMFSPLLFGEALYWMGLNDYAIHYFFESRAGNPTYRENAMANLRLAECYILDGDFAIATKYLNRLSKTMFRSKLADHYLNLIKIGRVYEDPLFAMLRPMRLRTDGIQSANKIEKPLEDLLEQNPNNSLAYQYLVGYKLLNRDLEGIARLCGSRNQLPYHVQEALVQYWYNTRGSLDGIPPVISKDLVTKFSMGIHDPYCYRMYYNAKQ